MGRAKGGLATVATMDRFGAVMGGRRGAVNTFMGANLTALASPILTVEAQEAGDKLYQKAVDGFLGAVVLELKKVPESPAREWVHEKIADLLAEEALITHQDKYQAMRDYLPALEASDWENIKNVHNARMTNSLRQGVYGETPDEMEQHLKEHASRGYPADIARAVARVAPSADAQTKAGWHERYLEDEDILRQAIAVHLPADTLIDEMPQDRWRSIAESMLINPKRAKNSYVTWVRRQLPNKHPEVQAELAQSEKRIHEVHSSVMSANLLRDKAKNMRVKAEDIAQATGLTKSVVRKVMMRSAKERTVYNSGHIAKLENVQKVCDYLGVDWAVVQLASMTPEMADKKPYRDARGRLNTRRYRTAQACLTHLRQQGADQMAIDAVAALVEGTRRPDDADTNNVWQDPFRELIHNERSRLGI